MSETGIQPTDLEIGQPTDQVDADSKKQTEADIIPLDVSDEAFLKSLKSVDFTESQYDFSQEYVDQVVSRFLQILKQKATEKAEEIGDHPSESATNQEMDRILFHEYLDVFLPKTRDLNKENIQDQILTSVIGRAIKGEDLSACRVLLEHTLIRSANMIRPKVLFGAVKDLTWNTEICPDNDQRKAVRRMNDDLLDTLSYNINLSSDYYREEALKEFRDADNPTEQLKIVEFLRNCYFRIDWMFYNPQNKSTDSLKEAAKTISDETDNYFVKARVKLFLSEITNNESDQMSSNVARNITWNERQNDKFISDNRSEEAKLIKMYIGDKYDKEKHTEQLKALLRRYHFRYELMALQRENTDRDLMFIDLSPEYVGAYDASGNLQKIISEASSENSSISELPVMGLQEGENKADRLKEMSILLSLPIREEIEKDFEIDLGTLDFSVQYYFLNFLKNSNSEQAMKFAEFTKKFGADGFKTFLSFDGGEKIPEAVLKINNEYPEEIAKQIFSKYAEIVDATRRVGEYIRHNYGTDPNFNEEMIEKSIQNLLKRGRDLLVSCAKNANNPDQITSGLEDISGDVVMLLDSMKSLKESGVNIEFRDCVNVSYESVEATDLDDETKKKMAEILKLNYSEIHNDSLDLETVSALRSLEPLALSDMNASFNSRSTEFHFFKLDGKIVAFWRFDKNEDFVHFGSFNVNPNYRGSAIGGEVMKNNVNEMSKENIVRAEVACRLDIASHYIKSGFVAEEILIQPSGHNFEGFEIIKDHKVNSKYRYSGAGLDSIKRAAEYFIEDDPIDENMSSVISTYNFSNEADYSRFIEDCQKMFKSGHVLTSFLRDGKKRFCAFEKKLERYDMNFEQSHFSRENVTAA